MADIETLQSELRIQSVEHSYKIAAARKQIRAVVRARFYWKERVGSIPLELHALVEKSGAGDVHNLVCYPHGGLIWLRVCYW